MAITKNSALESLMSLIRRLKDQNSRTQGLARSLTWRVYAKLTTTLIAHLITGEVRTAMVISGIVFVLKFSIYYGHE